MECRSRQEEQEISRPLRCLELAQVIEWSGWVGCFSAIELLKLTLKVAISNASQQIPQESKGLQGS